jgi:glycine betaine/proline transport system substrate-binding protein
LILPLVILAVLVAVLTLVLSACAPEQTIIIGEGNWDSNAFHDQVAKIMIEEGYGVPVDVVPADTSIMVSGLISGDVNLSMELWSDNVLTYDSDIAAGSYVELSTNFDDNTQGLYIPAYLQEEYPDLVSVDDLIDYVDLFPNPEGGDLGIIYGGPEGWSATEHLHNKMVEYGLDEYFEFKTIDSSATLNATLGSAYAQGEPWVGYNWEPTWTLGVYDMVLLEDSEYSAEDFAAGIGAFPSVDVNVVVDATFEDNYPEVFAFLQNYETSSEITSSALAYMQENDLEAEDAAIWFLENYEDLWSEWVTEDAYNNIMEYIG